MIDRSDEYRDMHAAESGDLLVRMFNGAWLDTQEFPALEYAVPGIIPEGLGVLVSPPKAGKSWLVCGIGLACAAGGLALGCIPVDKRPVLYLALEDGKRRLQSRSRSLMRGQPLPADIHFVIKAKPSEVIPMMAEFLTRYGTEKPIIILDTLGKARPARPAGTDLYAWDYAIGTQLKDTIDTAPGATLLVVHHTRKAESLDFVDSISGSHGIAGSADFVLVLSRKRHSDEARLSVTGRDVAEIEYALTTTDGLWKLAGDDLSAAVVSESVRISDTVSDTRSATSVDIFNVVVSDTAPVSPAVVSETLGLDNDTVGRYLRRLAAEGLIERAGRGLYKRVSEVSECPNGLFDASESTETNDSDTSDTQIFREDESGEP